METLIKEQRNKLGRPLTTKDGKRTDYVSISDNFVDFDFMSFNFMTSNFKNGN